MKRNTICLCFLFLMFMFSSRAADYKILTDGVVVHPEKVTGNGAKSVRLQVVSDQIIHVIATPSNDFSAEKSLMITDYPHNKVIWKTETRNGWISLSTDKIKASVSLKTGEVVFSDLKGNIFLRENEKGGKTFQAETVDGVKGYQIRQVFESPSGEAFYGLGENQDDILNFKGLDDDLTQRNTKAVVPFLVSNKKYGILWDNYSVTRFGDPRDYMPISGLKLYTDDGTLGGLTAHYCSKSSPDQDMTTRQETVIDYEFLKSMKNAPAGFSMKDGLVKWSGFIGSDVPGLHKFAFSAAGYAKVWIDGKLILDKWRQCWNPNTYKFNLDMQPGKKYALKIEWIPDGDESFLALKYLTPYPSTEQGKLSLYSEMGNQIDYYFVHGSNLDQVISGYRFLTGRAPIVPKWAMGLWQSRQRYKTQDEILSVVKEFRQRNIPLDNIVLDWQYWRIDKWGDHEFDSARFANPVGMLKDLHNTYHTQMMISVWPKFYEGTANYKLFDEKGWLYKQNIINRQKDWIGYISTFYDAFNPQARDLFWKLINEKLFSKGIDAWWLDATEPDILSNISVADRKSLMNPTYLGPATKVFNAFPLMNAKGVYEGQRKTNPDQRVFILTRSAYAGSQRYAAATWSGDIASRWHDMKDQIATGLSFSVSGIPYWTMDIGGFSDETRYQNANETDLEEWRELNTRWFQFGAFCPLFRVHGEFPYREIYNIAPENHPAYQSMLYYDQLRYRMMPYLYSLAGLTYHKNYTLMRPLVMDFINDTAALNVKDEYMFGPALLVCPVYTYKARERAVYLPSTANWYELYSGKYFKGGQSIQADAPYSHIPVFVKEGSIIPFGPEIQYSTEKPADPVTLYVYTGHDATFSLYEDENVNYNYEKGKYSIIPVSYDEKIKTLKIGKRQGSFSGMLNRRTFKIMWIHHDKPVALNFNNENLQTVKYDGSEILVKEK